MACLQTRRVLSQIFSATDYIDPEILARCLIDLNDETLLIEGLKASSRTVIPLDFKMIVELRRGLLDHLSAVCPTSEIHNVLINDILVRVLTTASTVSRMLPAFRKAVGIEKNEKVSCN